MPASKYYRQRVRFSAKVDGKKHWADYYIENGRVTVEVVTEDAIVVEKTTQVGASAVLTARMLLKELVRSGRLQEPGC